MHECPRCGMVCDCDWEDTWNDPPKFCECRCEELEACYEDEMNYDGNKDDWP